MVRLQTPCSEFQVRVMMFKLRAVECNCRVDFVDCAAYRILSTVVCVYVRLPWRKSQVPCESVHVLCRYVQ